MKSKIAFFLYILLMSSVLMAKDNCRTCNTPSGIFQNDLYTGNIISAFDIPYTNMGAMSRKLDFYGVIDKCNKRPLVIILPGSGFVKSDREGEDGNDFKRGQGSIAMASYFTNKGYAVAVLDYNRVSDPCSSLEVANTVIHQAAQDINAALQGFVRYATALSIDPDNIFVIGSSAGGIAALSAIFSDMNGALLTSELQPSNIGSDNALNFRSLPDAKNTSYAVKAFAGISTGIPTAGIFDNRYRNKDIPMIFIHGNADLAVPFLSGAPNGCKELTLCGSGCIVERIRSEEGNVNCFKLNEVISSSHSLLFQPEGGFSSYTIPYLGFMKDFFFDMMSCYSCESYHNVYPAPVYN